jgi:hypothetical protein
VNARVKAERLPRWKDCLVLVVLGVTAIAVVLLSLGAGAAVWVGVRWGCLTVLVIALTAVRQRSGVSGRRGGNPSGSARWGAPRAGKSREQTNGLGSRCSIADDQDGASRDGLKTHGKAS